MTCILFDFLLYFASIMAIFLSLGGLMTMLDALYLISILQKRGIALRYFKIWQQIIPEYGNDKNTEKQCHQITFAITFYGR